MKSLNRLLLGLLIVLALVRAVAFGVYAWVELPLPLETFHLEAKMVLLAYRAEVGLPLYPDWQGYPYVANFFGPVYFALVGWIGRATGADIPELFTIGRVVSLVSGILTSLIVGVWVARRSGWVLGLAGALISYGTTAMIGFSVMTRPDMFAELLGVVGFLLASGPRRWHQILGALVLILAVLTKQTTIVFLAAAALGWIAEGAWRRGLTLGIGTTLALVGVIGLVTWLVEPHFAASLAGESKAPWSRVSLDFNLTKICVQSFDTVYFPLVAIVLWSVGATGRREARLAIFAALILGSSVLTSAKIGADANYYLTLRVLDALAVGALWQTWARTSSRLRASGLAVLALVGIAGLGLGSYLMVQQTRFEYRQARVLQSTMGRAFLASYRPFFERAADPKFHLLTDSGLIDLYARDRAVFGDPWLFRLLTRTGRLDPHLVRDRIDAGYYDLIVTTSEVHLPTYDRYDFGLPKVLADRIRARYSYQGTQAGMFIYERRQPPGVSPAGSPARRP